VSGAAVHGLDPEAVEEVTIVNVEVQLTKC
jgi:hypothetical protein